MRRDRGDHADLTPDQLVTFVIQDHKGHRSGDHLDVRLGTPETGLYSWATRRELPRPGERPTGLYRAALHPHGWGDFQGPLRSGGEVKLRERGQARIREVAADRLAFGLVHRDPVDEYLFKKLTENSWLAINRNPEAVAETTQQIKRGGLAPTIALQDHQRRVAAKMVPDRSRLLLYHGLGTGKSISSLAAAEAAGEPYVAVVPAALRDNFRKEIAKATDGQTPSAVLSYNAAARRKDPGVAPGTLVLDEVQRIRNPESQAAQGVAELAARANRLVMLSGTPVVNSPGDLAMPLHLLTGKKITPAGFERRYVQETPIEPNWVQRRMGVTPGVTKTIANRRELVKLFKGHVDYQPPATPDGVTTRDERVEVTLSPEQKAFYDLAWGKLPFFTRWKLQNRFPLAPSEVKRLSSFMTGPRQAALSLGKYTDNDPARAFQSSPKLREAARRLEARLQDPRAKALVFSNFPDAGLKPYANHLNRAGIPSALFDGKLNDAERKQVVDDYNAGKLRVMMLGPAGSEGISTKGTQLIQLLDPHFNAARSDQSRGRGLRFDSHVGLPDDLRDVAVERYVAKLPEPSWIQRQIGAKRQPSSDEILERMAAEKERLNEQFRAVLREAAGRR